MEITRQQELEWHRRIAGLPPLVPLGDVHAQLDAIATRFEGNSGLASLFGGARAKSSAAKGFSALRVSSHVGEVTISRVLATPYQVEWPPHAGGASAISVDELVRDGTVTVHVQYGGVAQVTADRATWSFRPGSMRYVCSGFPHQEELSGLTDVLSATVPISRLADLAGHLGALPMDRFPDNDINLGMAAFAGRFLFRRLVGPPQQSADEADQEEAVISVLRSALVPLFRGKTASSGAEVSRLIDNEIELNHRDPSLSVNKLAESVGLSRRQLYRYATSGLADRLGRRRAETAKGVIESSPDLELGLVAGVSGFSDANRMRHHFVKAFGVLPSVYREQMRRSGEDQTRD